MRPLQPLLFNHILNNIPDVQASFLRPPDDRLHQGGRFSDQPLLSIALYVIHRSRALIQCGHQVIGGGWFHHERVEFLPGCKC